VGARGSDFDRASIAGAIVAGGENARFGGRPKGLYRVGGGRIIDRVAAALRTVVRTVVLIANDPDAAQWLPGVPVHRDERAARGSLVGLETAVRHAGGPVLVVAWDMPFVEPGLLALIASGLTAGVNAVVPEGPRGPEPMCALYTPECLPAIERALADGDLRLGSLVARLPGLSRIPLDRVAALADPARLFFNVNDQADLELAERMAGTI
jgi:molybdopterin-guanine dinucleotide biosynthesis protein A